MNTQKSLFIISFFIFLLIGFTQCKKIRCKENLKGDCYCLENYAPVCGCNGKTYGNACDAECNGISDYKNGACK